MCLDDEQVLNGCLISSTGQLVLILLHVHIVSTVTGKLTFCPLSSPVNRSSELNGLSIARVKQQGKERPSVHKQQSESRIQQSFILFFKNKFLHNYTNTFVHA